MASGVGLNGGQGARAKTVRDSGKEDRMFKREFTILVDVIDNRRIKAVEVIDSICEVAGEGAVYACIPRASDSYEVTVSDEIIVDLLTDGDLLISGVRYICTEVVRNVSKPMMVSFMHLPAYIADTDIADKLSAMKVKIVGEIRRHYYPDSNVADGTRLVRVILPPELRSLPYSMKFVQATGNQYYRVIHNNQVKLCRICSSDQHLMQDCPDYVCHQCGIQGHIKRNCQTPRCGACSRFGLTCACDNDDGMTESVLSENTNVVRKCGECHQFVCVCAKGGDGECERCGLIGACECCDDEIVQDRTPGSVPGSECEKIVCEHAPAPVNVSRAADQLVSRVIDEQVIGADQRVSGQATDQSTDRDAAQVTDRHVTAEVASTSRVDDQDMSCVEEINLSDNYVTVQHKTNRRRRMVTKPNVNSGKIKKVFHAKSSIAGK
jgi:hypothetical protein